MLKLLCLVVPLLAVVSMRGSMVSGERGGLFREYKEDLNEYLTSEEVDRLVYGNDESVISEKIKNLPDGNMSPPGIIQHHLPVPTMDPSLDSVVAAHSHGPIIKKLPPQRNNFMNMMKQAARMLASRNSPNRAPRQRNPVPQYRARPSSLTSSEPDQLEVAFKRIEIMASRAGLNMSSMPRRTQMQIIKRLSTKLPPRMQSLMKATLDHNSVKLYDYLPEPARDPLIEDNPDYISHFMDNAKVTMDGADFSINEHHTYEYTEPTAHEIIHPTSQHSDVIFTDHQPGTDYSIPSFDTTGPSGGSSSSIIGSSGGLDFNAPPPTYNVDTISGPSASSSSSSSVHFGQSTFDQSQPTHQSSIVSYETSHGNSNSGSDTSSSHKLDLKPIAAPLISETHDIQYAAESENLPTIISLNSPRTGPPPARSNKALKVSSIRNVTPASPLIRVSMPTKDEIKMSKPIRVSIITKDNSTNINPIHLSVDPIFPGEVKEVKTITSSDHQEQDQEQASKEKSEEITKIINKEVPKSTVTTTTSVVTTQDTPVEATSAAAAVSAEDQQQQQTLLQQLKQSHKPTQTTQTKFSSLTDDDTLLNPTAGLLLKEFDDYGDDQDLTSSELIAELKKYNSDYANSLELDYPLAPHPLEYPDHPDHPDNSDSILSTMSTLAPTPRPTMQQQQIMHEGLGGLGGRPQHKRPGGPPGRPPFRPRIRPPPGPHNGGRPHNNRHHGPRRPARPPPPPPHGRPPLRINEVTVSQIPHTTQKECDYFSEDLCLVVQDYPIEAISEAMSTQDSNKLIVKEPTETSWVDGVGKTQESGYNFKHYYGNVKVNPNGDGGSHRHRDFAGEGGFLCPSKVAYGRVKKGKSYTNGEWKYIVNYGDISQTLRLEKCLSPGNSCSYVLPYYRTACTQVYNYHRLLAWDSEKGLHMDVFKIPTCCTCHVQGYYVPGQQQQGGMTPARRRDLPPKLQYSPQQQQRLRQAHLQQQQQQQQVHLRREQLSQQQAQLSKQQQSKFNDELQDLLAQYSSLRERIAKKKNERASSISYSVSYSNSTKENSKRESSPSINHESSSSQRKTPMQRLHRAMLFNLMKRIKKSNSTITKKKLTQLLKHANLTAKPIPNVNVSKSSHFNGTAHKLKSSRALTLHKIANLLTVLKRNSRHNNKNGTVAAAGGGRPIVVSARRTSSSRLAGQRSMSSTTTGLSQESQRQFLQQQKLLLQLQKQKRQGRISGDNQSKLEKLKLLLSRSLLKNRHRLNMNSRLGSSNGNPGPINNKRLQLLHQLQQQRRKNQHSRTKQRLRLSSKKPSKVNYSYHPIMDYFGSKPS